MEQAIVYCEILHSKYKVDFTKVTTRRIKKGTSKYEKIPLKDMDIPNIAHIIKENNWDGNFSIAGQIVVAHTIINRRAKKGTKIDERKAILTDEQINRLATIPRFSYV